MAIEFGLENRCTNHVCYHKKLFKEMREAPEGIGIICIGRVRKPEGIRTFAFQLTDSMGNFHQIELKSVFYISDAPKNLILITQWSEERKDNCGILSQHIFNFYVERKYTSEIGLSSNIMQDSHNTSE
eukprot:7219549-Ditylum_brightwellii.AAC.1